MKKQSSSQQPATSRPMNHACRDVGHDWQLTTDETIRQCTRHDCRAVERLIYGSWMPVSSSATQDERQQPPAASAFYRQLAFWAEQPPQRSLEIEALTLFTKEQ